MSDVISKIDTALKWSFYSIFFLTPLILYPKTFELFEFNKMWFVFIVSLIILFLWISKMVISEKFIFRRTPFDIPLMLFLASQIVSTIFSIDPHVSFWGYYSRFNGGLLSTITYIFLYYAFISNFSFKKDLLENGMGLKVIFASLLSGAAVAIWGFSSHFGYDLTCLMFRGTLDVSCWTEAFQPTVRIFSTLGQPNWLAAYFSILIPLGISLGIYKLALFFDNGKYHVSSIKYYVKEKEFIRSTLYLLLATLLFVEVLWTSSQSGFLGLGAGLAIFIAFFMVFVYKKSNIKKLELKLLVGVFTLFALFAFLLGNPLANRFSFLSLPTLLSSISVGQNQTTPQPTPEQEASAIPALEGGGSDSGKIRLIVWTGAIEIFKRHPIVGSGVETFAYAYYKVKPVEHNLLSEWDYLYNKAHNEYLNYLSTTGILGLGTYLIFIIWFLFYAVKKFIREDEHGAKLLELGLISSFVTILVSNFFGFSVVMTNLYLFFIPALFLSISSNKVSDIDSKPITPIKSIAIFIIGCICLYFLFYLLKIWTADQKYNLGYNMQKLQEYVAANPELTEAVRLVPGEPLYKDELASNMATLAYLLYSQDQATEGAKFAQQAVMLSDEVVKNHPLNLTFYKTRVRVFFTLAQADPKYLPEAIKAVERAKFLAPTDAKVSYNAGLLYGQDGQIDRAIEELKHTLKLKPNYRDPRFAMANFLKEKAESETNPAKKEQLLQEARATLEYSLKNITPNDPQVEELLKSIQ